MKTLFSVSFLFLFSIVQAQSVNDFVTIWDMSVSGSSPNSFTFKTSSSALVNYTWQTIPAGTSGNGTFTGNSATIGGLPLNALIELRIDTQNFKRFFIDTNSDKSRLKEVKQWGKSKWTSMENAFSGCQNLILTATDAPDLSNVTSMKRMFADASNMDEAIGNWNTSNVTDMSMLFKGAAQFNQALNNWNTSNVTTMKEMFKNATFFDQPLSTWNTAAVTDMSGMFEEAYAFNQPLAAWNTSTVTNMSNMFAGALFFNQPIGAWNVSNVSNMDLMFTSADNFNQPLNTWSTTGLTSASGMFLNNASFNQPIHAWNTSNVTVMEDMFNGALSFNQTLGPWQINSSLLFLARMLNNSGMDCANYSSTLDSWSQQTSAASGVTLGAIGISYGTNVQAQRATLVSTKNWTISGDIAEPEDCIFFPVSNQPMEKKPLSVSIYPNPCDKQAYIKFNADENAHLSVKLLDATGKLLISQNFNSFKGQNLFPLDLSGFSAGVYILNLQLSNSNRSSNIQILKH